MNKRADSIHVQEWWANASSDERLTQVQRLGYNLAICWMTDSGRITPAQAELLLDLRNMRYHTFRASMIDATEEWVQAQLKVAEGN